MKRSVNIKGKVLLFIISCLVIVFGTLFMYLNLIMKPKSIEETTMTIGKVAESKSNEISAWVNKKAVEYRAISSTPAFSSMDIREITPIIDRFTEMHIKNGEEMETFSYIGKNGFSWINSEATEDLMNYEDYRRAYLESKEYVIGLPVLNKNNREVVLFYYPVVGYGNEKEALICSAVPLVGLKEIVDTSNVYGGKTWVMNRDKNILTTNVDYFHNNYLDVETVSNLDTEAVNSLEIMKVRGVDGKMSTLFLSPIAQYDDWISCILVKDEELSRSTDEIIRACVMLFLVLMFLTISFGLFLTKSVLKPIKNLQSCMNRVEEGDLSAYFDTNSTKDEIYELGMSYNKMLDEIDKLIKTIYREQSEKREAEMIALQSQIKPHFLYNTLDNIKWMAKKQGAEDVAKTITQLSNLFRISLNNGREFLTVADEFKHTKSYLDIQSIRYKEKLNYSISLEDELKDYEMVKIIVQPIVENAIYHGIKPKVGIGNVNVVGKLVGKNIEITVEDDGIGISESDLEDLRRILIEMDTSEHFGLVNTKSRLLNAYGDRASIEVDSEFGVGTKVTICIPVEVEVNV